MDAEEWLAQSDDALVACDDLVGRTGAKALEVGFLRADCPPEEAGWYAIAIYQGAKIVVEEKASPTEACFALAVRLLTGAQCRCGQKVTLTDRVGCRWRQEGPKWVPGCDVAPVRISGPRGDVAALRRAMEERRKGGPGVPGGTGGGPDAGPPGAA